MRTVCISSIFAEFLPAEGFTGKLTDLTQKRFVVFLMTQYGCGGLIWKRRQIDRFHKIREQKGSEFPQSSMESSVAMCHRFRPILVLAFLLTAALTHAAFGQTAGASHAANSENWNGWYYQGPAGWRAQATPEAMVFTPAQAGSLNRMRLLAPEPMQGTLSDWFTNVSRREASSYRSFHLNAMQQASTVHGKPRVYCTGQAINAHGQQLVISYEGVESLDGKGLLMATEFETLSSFRYLALYGKFVASLEPGSAERAAKRNQPSQDANQPAPGSRHHRETDQTDKPGTQLRSNQKLGDQPAQPKL
jgi:hypothetical protein